MRVIGGIHRSRKLKPVPGTHTRPTPDRLREALFNVLAPRMQGAVFVDAYAGTGAVGLEALSRGASRAVLIEQHASALAILRQNVQSLHLESQAVVVRGSAALVLPNYPCDIAFVDPPYDRPDEYQKSMNALAAGTCTIAVAQHSSREQLADCFGTLKRGRTLRQGDNTLSFYERA